jgi:hypothetical protein
LDVNEKSRVEAALLLPYKSAAALYAFEGRVKQSSKKDAAIMAWGISALAFVDGGHHVVLPRDL